MSVRYYSEFEQRNNRPDKRSIDLVRIEISDISYSGEAEYLEMGSSPIQITYSEQSADNVKTIIGSQASFQLLATNEFELNHLYTDQEMKWMVDIKRNGSVFWKGFIIPDGCSENFIDPPYVVNARAVDGLGILKNIPYSPSDDKKSVLKIISECLVKSSLGMPINTFNLLEYEGMALDSDSLNETYVWASRFYKGDDDKVPMSCAEVLESLLDGWGSSVFQNNGEWWVVNTTDLSISEGVFDYFSYTPQGVFIEKRSKDINLVLGNNEGDVIHASYDQVRSIEKPYKRVSVKYTYGAINDTLNYAQRLLLSDGLTFNFQQWEKVNGVVADPRPIFGGQGVPAVIHGKNVSTISADFLALNNSPYVSSDFSYNLEITFNAGSANGIPFLILWRANPESTQYVLADDNTWQTATPGPRFFYDYVEKTNSDNDTFTWGMNRVSKGNVSFEVPGDGQVTVFLYRAFYKSNNSFRNVDTGRLEVFEVSLTPVVNNERGSSETHTLVNDANFTYTPDEINVANGDSSFYAFRGAIFKADQETLTDKWRKKGTAEYFSFLRVAVTDIMRRRGRPMNVYEGTVYGYFDYFSIFTITHLSGKFMVISADYDIKNNKTNVVLLEIDHINVPSQYSLTYEEKEVPTSEIKQI